MTQSTKVALAYTFAAGASPRFHFTAEALCFPLHNVDRGWQSAHIVPPLLRCLHKVELEFGRPLNWSISGISSPFEAVTGPVTVFVRASWAALSEAIERGLAQEKHFRRTGVSDSGRLHLKHQLGWSFSIKAEESLRSGQTIHTLARLLDPLAIDGKPTVCSDLHLHTAWSDGNASVNAMAKAIALRGLKFFAVTDHSGDIQGKPFWLERGKMPDQTTIKAAGFIVSLNEQGLVTWTSPTPLGTLPVIESRTS